MAFFLLQTAIVANDAYVTLNRGRRFVRTLFSIWSSQMKNFQHNLYKSMSNPLFSPNLFLE